MQAEDMVTYLGASPEQATFADTTDPRPHLKVGDVYCIEAVVVHKWHTAIWLEGEQGWFNSVCFAEATDA